MENKKTKNTNSKNVFFLLLLCLVVTAGCTFDKTTKKDEFLIQTDLQETAPLTKQIEELADTQVLETEKDIKETTPVIPESVNIPVSTDNPTAEDSNDQEVRESWTQITGAEVIEIDPENMLLSIKLDESTEEVIDETEIQTEEQTEKKSEIMKLNVSELVLSQNNVILSKDDSATIVQENKEVIAFDEIQPNDFIIIQYEGIENNEILNVQNVTKMFYEIESEVEDTKIQEGDMVYLQGEISELDTNENTLEYIYTYTETIESNEETLADKATVKFLENGKIYQINDIDELNDIKNSQEISFAELKIGQTIYIKTQSIDDETNQIVILKQ